MEFPELEVAEMLQNEGPLEFWVGYQSIVSATKLAHDLLVTESKSKNVGVNWVLGVFRWLTQEMVSPVQHLILSLLLSPNVVRIEIH